LRERVVRLEQEVAVQAREIERLWTLVSQQSSNQRLDTYLSQVLGAVATLILGGSGITAIVSAIASFITVEDDVVQVRIFLLLVSALAALLALTPVKNRLQAIDAKSREDPAVERRYLRLSLTFAVLYLLGVVLFVAVTVLYAVNY
jgi:hypothetical protein